MTGALKKVMKYTDLIAAGLVVLVVVMLVVPLPPFLLDLFITLNISVALAIVITTLYLPRALDFSAFPALLLLTTMFRLAINVSVTRLILLDGDAGHVVKAFGEFVVGGNVVVGLVVFLILIVINFVVVTNGAGRVAEVGARFTLDAMPGKQMAIDADLNAGQITEDEARQRRDDIAREADFYGAMDGASKFVKGDAMAAMIITAINLIGGIVIGVIQHGDADRRGRPALLAPDDRRRPDRADPRAAHLGRRGHHRHAQRVGLRPRHRRRRPAHEAAQGPDGRGRRHLRLRARPGPPEAAVPRRRRAVHPGRADAQDRRAGGGRRQALADEQQAALPAPANPGDQAREALQIDPLELAIGFGLVNLVDASAGGSLLSRVSAVRRQIAGELGTVIPSVRIHDEVGLASHEYVLKVRGTVVARGKVLAGHQLALDPGDAVGQLSGIPTTEPAFGLPAVWIADAARAEAEALGYTVVDAESVIVTHLTETIRHHVADLLTRQDVRALLDGLKEVNAAVVEEVVPDLLSVGEVQRVLQALLREGVSIRDLGAIVEAVGDRARVTRDPALLAEYARQALARAIVAPHLDEESRLRVIVLDPALEQEVSDAIAADGRRRVPRDGPAARPEPRLRPVRAVRAGRSPRGRRPVLLCSSRVRRHLRRLCEQALPQVAVCAYNEIPPGVGVETMGVVAGAGVPVAA